MARSAIIEIIDWLDNNQMAGKDEFDDQQKELEKVCTPIIQKLYQTSSARVADGAGASSNGANNDGGSGKRPFDQRRETDEHAKQLEHQKIIQAKKDLEKFAHELKLSLEKAVCACNEVLDWVGSDKSARKEEYDRQHKMLEEACRPVLDKLGHFKPS